MSSPFRIVVLASGRGTNLQVLIDSVHQHPPGMEIVAVVSDKPKAKALELAIQAGIPTFAVSGQTDKTNLTRSLIEATAAAQPDLIVLAGFMRILQDEYINAFKDKIINIHPSLLPAFRGLGVHEAAIKAGARFSGCTVHYVVPEVDAGPIIAQAVVPILPQDTPDILAARILKQEHRLLPVVVKGLAEGKIRLVKNESQEFVFTDSSLCLPDDSIALRSLV